MERDQASEQLVLAEIIIDTENGSIIEYPELEETHKD